MKIAFLTRQDADREMSAYWRTNAMVRRAYDWRIFHPRAKMETKIWGKRLSVCLKAEY